MIHYSKEQLQDSKKIAETKRSTVYVAKMESENVVVKCPKSSRAALSEADMLFSLDHPNIIKLKGVLPDHFNALVMEHMNQGNLNKYLNDKNYPGVSAKEAEVRDNILIDVLTGLVYLHAKGIIHRDIKCANIFITLLSSGQLLAKLGDFDSAKKVNLDDKYYVSGMDKPVGTEGYAAPEVYDTNNSHNRCIYSRKSDVFSFAVVMLATKSDRLNDKFWELQSDHLPIFPKEISAETKKMLLLGFKINPDERISAEDLLKICKEKRVILKN